MKTHKSILIFGGLGFVLLVVLGITFTIGWRPFIGPRVRPLTDRKFEPTAARLERGSRHVDSKGPRRASGTNSQLLGLPHTAGRQGQHRDSNGLKVNYKAKYDENKTEPTNPCPAICEQLTANN